MRAARVIALSRPRAGATLAAALVVVGCLAAPATGAPQPLPTPAATHDADDQAVPEPAVCTDEDTVEPADGADEPVEDTDEGAAEPAEGTDDEAREAVTGTDDPADPHQPDGEEDADPPGGDETAGPAGPGTEETAEPVDPAEDLVVVPAVEHLDGAQGYLLPHQRGLIWLVNGVPVADLVHVGAARFVPAPAGEPSSPPSAGRYEITARGLGVALDAVVVAVVAEPGYRVVGADGQPVRYVIDRRAPVEMIAPSATDGAGREGDVVTVPDVLGQVVRDVTGDELGLGEHPVTAEYVDGTATVELGVEAAAGYRLELDGGPVETTPGAGGRWTVALTFTDSGAQDQDVDEGAAADPADIELDDAAEPPAGLDVTHLVTVRAAAPEPDVQRLDAEPAAGESGAAAVTAAPEPTRPTDPAPQNPSLMALLSILFVGGAWLVLGAGRDMLD